LQKKIPAPPNGGALAEFIGHYVKAFQARYGVNTRPDLSGKTLGQIKRYLSDPHGPGAGRAVELIQVYCQMDGERAWFRTRHHDFTTFVENQNAVRTALAHGGEGGDKPIEELLREREERGGLR
jgi:hypothetical protein